MIRLYNHSDKSELINLIRLNTPNYFHPSEEKDFIHYLDNEIEDYFVLEENGKIIGTGGINYFPEKKLARLSWDMVHPNYHGKGLGSEITKFRIDHIRKNTVINAIEVRTSQLVFKYYQKMGFELEKIEKDYWAKGFDLYQMRRGS